MKESGEKRDIIAVGSFNDDAVVAKVLAKGAKYYLMKPVSAGLVVERVKELTSEKRYAAPNPSSVSVRERKSYASLDEKISNIFISIGIPASIKGYGYLREGVKMAVENPFHHKQHNERIVPENCGEVFHDSEQSRARDPPQH